MKGAPIMAASQHPRAKRTREERAQHALDVATRNVERLQTKHDKLMDEAAAIEPEIDAAKTRRDYLATSPDLPQPTLVGDTASEPVVEQPRVMRDEPQA